VVFDKNDYDIRTFHAGNESLECVCYNNLVYADNPVNPAFQSMNLFAPKAYLSGGEINGYTRATAPIFLPNTVGGYMPGPLAEPGLNVYGPPVPNSVFRALEHGYVTACPAIRGRSQPQGKAPACIADYKAAVRCLRHIAGDLPGDTERIITNGTSAGGALSALMGATGNDAGYDAYLDPIGAAHERDDVFAASCYCPIINLENADAAYEWQFQGVNEYHRMKMKPREGGRPSFTPEDGKMTGEQIAVSNDLAKLFPAYVNSQNLMKDGRQLTLDGNGEGSFKEYVKSIVLDSARAAIDCGEGLSGMNWLAMDGAARAIDMDFSAYARAITRMKTAPAFDGLSLESPENHLFGVDAIPAQEIHGRHFTLYSYLHSKVNGAMCDPSIVELLNPMPHIGKAGVTLAKHWRIRHGEADRDTSLAISSMLVLKLLEQGCSVDYGAPWGVPHAGDYDLDALFAWIDRVCGQESAVRKIA
jgi:hypothetical protein